MLSKKELIEKIDLALYSVLLTHYGNDRDVDEELCEELATAALQALLSSLPDEKPRITKTKDGIIWHEEDFELAKYYKQLLSMKDK